MNTVDVLLLSDVISARVSVTQSAENVSFTDFKGGCKFAEKQRYQEWASSVVGERLSWAVKCLISVF